MSEQIAASTASINAGMKTFNVTMNAINKGLANSATLVAANAVTLAAMKASSIVSTEISANLKKTLHTIQQNSLDMRNTQMAI